MPEDGASGAATNREGGQESDDSPMSGGQPTAYSVKKLSEKDARMMKDIDAAHLAQELSQDSPPPLFPAGALTLLLPS